MLSFRRALMLMAALAMSAGAAPLVLANQPAMISAGPRTVSAAKRGLFGGFFASAGLYGRRGAGVTMAQQKRASRKARNVARTRRR